MIFKILTIFPEMIEAVIHTSILGRAINSGAIQVQAIDIRPFSQSKHKNTDDAPYGGGAGMVMTPQPAIDAIRFAMGENFNGKRIYLSPKGETFTQQVARRLSKEEQLILFCGHYEGIDQRIIDSAIDEEISIGDYVLTGGELGALTIVDAVARLLPGVLGSDISSVDESFSEGLLEYPQYTRPAVYENMSVPQVLLGGNQKQIDRFRRDEAIKLTYARRPELLRDAPLDANDRALIRRLNSGNLTQIKLICSDAQTKMNAITRIDEASNGSIGFTGDELALVLDETQIKFETAERIMLSRLPSECELDTARQNNTELFGFSPLAFDAGFLRITGDAGIKQAIFSGMNADEFACLSARLLDVTRIDEKAVHYKKSARAILKKGAVPACHIEFTDKTSLTLNLNRDNSQFFASAINFLKTGKSPISEEIIAKAKEIKAMYEEKV